MSALLVTQANNYLTANYWQHFSAFKDERSDQSRVDCGRLLYFFVVPHIPELHCPCRRRRTEMWESTSRVHFWLENVILWRIFLDWWTRGRGLSSIEFWNRPIRQGLTIVPWNQTCFSKSRASVVWLVKDCIWIKSAFLDPPALLNVSIWKRASQIKRSKLFIDN